MFGVEYLTNGQGKLIDVEKQHGHPILLLLYYGGLSIRYKRHPI